MSDTDQTIEQKMVSFATSDHYQGAVELLRRSLTQVVSLIGENEFQTIRNAFTVEMETALIQRFIVQINKIKTGENLTEQL